MAQGLDNNNFRKFKMALSTRVMQSPLALTPQETLAGISAFLGNKVAAQDELAPSRPSKPSSDKFLDPVTPFESAFPVKVSMPAYVNHLIRHVSTSPATMVISLVYVERLIERLAQEFGCFLLTSSNAH